MTNNFIKVNLTYITIAITLFSFIHLKFYISYIENVKNSDNMNPEIKANYYNIYGNGILKLVNSCI